VVFFGRSFEVNRFLSQAVPGNEKTLAPCSATLWSCDYETCSLDNFTIPDGTLVLRPSQASSLGLDLAATTVTAAPSDTVSGQTGSAACTSSLAGNSEVIGIGVGIGATLGIALIAMTIFFYRERRRNARLQQIGTSLSGICYPNMNNMTAEKDSLLGQAGRRTTRGELRGDGIGVEVSGANMHDMG
jgi:hypothetical protein